MLPMLFLLTAVFTLLNTTHISHLAYSEPTTSVECTYVVAPSNFTTAISSALNGDVICLLPGVYEVPKIDIKDKSLTIQGLSSNPSDVKIVLTSGSLKLAPSENNAIVLRNLGVELAADSRGQAAIQIYWSGKRGSKYDIGTVVLENLVVNATQAVATSVQVGPDVKMRAFELRNSLVLAGDIGVQIGPDTSVTGVIVIHNNTIYADNIGIQVGPDSYVAAYLRISQNNISAGVVGVQIGPPTGALKAPPVIGVLELVGNTIASNSSNVLELRSFIGNNASIYLNRFIGNGSHVTFKIDTRLVDPEKAFLSTPDEVDYWCRNRALRGRLGNYYVDWTEPDDNDDCIVDYPRQITSVLSDANPLAVDPSSLYLGYSLWFIAIEELLEGLVGAEATVVMGGSVLVDYVAESVVLIATGTTLLIIGALFRGRRE